MSDPLNFLYGGPSLRSRRVRAAEESALIVRQDPFRDAIYLIARYELRIWFEPDWYLARKLAARFPHCLICSIPEESNTPSLRRIPAWRPRRSPNAFL